MNKGWYLVLLGITNLAIADNYNYNYTIPYQIEESRAIDRRDNQIHRDQERQQRERDRQWIEERTRHEHEELARQRFLEKH